MSDDLHELRAVARQEGPLGVCRAHPEREAFVTCGCCGDHLCDPCMSGMQEGLCGACAGTARSRLVPRGRRIVIGFMVAQLGYQVILGVSFAVRKLLQIETLAVLLPVFALSVWLQLRLYRGSELVRNVFVTLFGLAFVLNLIVGENTNAAVTLVIAGLLLSPSVSAYLSSRSEPS
jgi:hypothetical protein